MHIFKKVCVAVLLLLAVYGLWYQVYHRSYVLSPLLNIPRHFKEYPSRRLLGYHSYSNASLQQFESLVARKAPANDPELVAFVAGVIDPPSSTEFVKMSRPLVVTPQAAAIDGILNKKKRGFFVEAGALDGERSSNSIFFEIQRAWTGLLVEPDPYFYTQLVGKNRRCWSINACLSITPFVAALKFRESGGGHGKLLSENSVKFLKVPCFPLETLLLAVNVSTIDFFSLDVEGFELQVLKTIPSNKINIRSLAVEYLHGDERKYREYMESIGFKMIKKLHLHKPNIALYVDDLIFVNTKNSGHG